MVSGAPSFPVPERRALVRRRCRRGVLIGVVILTEVGCGRLGQYTSMAIGGDGLGLISYEDGPHDLLKVAHCEDTTCTRATISTVDAAAAGEVGLGSHTALAIGVDGLGLISYDGIGLRVAHCEDAACTKAQVTTLDPQARTLYSNAITIGRDGLGLIVYWTTSGSLRTAHCEDVACTRATLTSHGGDVGIPRPGGSASIAIGSDGLGIIAYPNSDLGVLKIAHCEDVACTTATFSTIDEGPHVPHVSGYVGSYPDTAIGADGLALTSYYESPVGNLRVAHCADLRCTRADVISIIDRASASGRVGTDTSLAIGRDGLALISYLAAGPGGFGSGALRVAHCEDASCTRATLSTLDVGAP